MVVASAAKVIMGTPAAIYHTVLEIFELFSHHIVSIVPYIAFFFVLHAIFQFILPSFWPGMYDFLGRKDEAAGKKVTRKELAINGRTKLISVIFAILVTSLSLYGLTSDWAEGLRKNVYTSHPITEILVRLAIGYFTWDIFTVIHEGYSIVWVLHGVCAFLVYAASLTPFLHYMGMVTLLFEASTPFLHLRKSLIEANRGSGFIFQASVICFGLIFIAVRIFFGIYKCWWPGQWADEMNELIAAGKAHNPSIVDLYKVNCFLLTMLNIFWTYEIFRTFFCSKRHKSGSNAVKKSAKKE